VETFKITTLKSVTVALVGFLCVVGLFAQTPPDKQDEQFRRDQEFWKRHLNEFTVSTPKGNLLVNHTSTRMKLGSFDMQGEITNTTAWDLKFLRLRVTFYDQSGNELSGLCPREPDGAYCEILGITAPARQTVPFTSGPVINSELMHLPGENPWDPMHYSSEKIQSYNLSFLDALYDIQYRFAMLKPISPDNMSFDDAFLSFKFSIDPKGIACSIRNKTGDPISVNWNVISYVDSSGDAHKVMHSGIRLVDKEAPQTPTLIPPTARISETLFPIDYILSGSGGLTQTPLWPDTGYVSKDESHLKTLEGSTFSIFMPIEVGGKSKNYSFVFKIVSVLY